MFNFHDIAVRDERFFVGMQERKETKTNFSVPEASYKPEEVLHPLVDRSTEIVVDFGTVTEKPEVVLDRLGIEPDQTSPKIRLNQSGSKFEESRKTPSEREAIIRRQKRQGIRVSQIRAKLNSSPVPSEDLETSEDKAPISHIMFWPKIAEPEGSTVIIDRTKHVHLEALKNGQFIEGLRVEEQDTLEEEDKENKEIVIDQYRTSDDTEVVITVLPSDFEDLMTQEEAEFKINDPAFKRAASFKASEESSE